MNYATISSQQQTAEARRIAAERGVSVSQARKIVSGMVIKAKRVERESRGVCNYQFRPLSPKHKRAVYGGEYRADAEAVEACVEHVARDGISRQVICDGRLVQVVTR